MLRTGREGTARRSVNCNKRQRIIRIVNGTYPSLDWQAAQQQPQPRALNGTQDMQLLWQFMQGRRGSGPLQKHCLEGEQWTRLHREGQSSILGMT